MTESTSSISEELLRDFSAEIYIQIIYENELGRISELVTPKTGK
jgi:hypothetical protein